jgi:hypothetical protein
VSEWIDERVKELQDRQERFRKIDSFSHKIFDDLWGQIVKDINYMKGQAWMGVQQLLTEGYHPNREMVIIKPTPKEMKQTHVSLNTDKRSVVVSGSSLRLEFPIRVCGDGSVCLKDEAGNKIEIQDAARRIVDPIAFPELQKPDTSQ